MAMLERHVNGARDAYGVTVTAVEQATGDARSFVEARGQALPGLRAIVEQIDELEGDWLIRTVSTPMTVLADLRNGGSTTQRRGDPPERRFLAAVGRLDLLEIA